MTTVNETIAEAYAEFLHQEGARDRTADFAEWLIDHLAEAQYTVVRTAPQRRTLVYLLWSQRHAGWWKPDARGYTSVLDEAGRFSETDAVRYVVQSAQSGIRDKVTFMVAAPDNWDDRVLKTPDEWQRLIPGIVIRDPDGWRGPGGRPWDDPITRSEYLERRNRCTITARPVDGPRHIMDLREDGWTIQHPLSCRPNLFACPVNRAAEQWLVPPRKLSGRYEVRLNDARDELLIGDRVEPEAGRS